MLPAPSNKYKAAVENQTVVVRGSNGETVFISDSQWGGGAKVHLLYWVGDTQLTYEILKPDGSKIQYLVDLSLKKEFRK
ncbi:hypothetical protein N6H14_22660 [Paenibacillus sp. CC-CFT747]|nr:hypothetical protein N6H14_22660 [Paenibacillus sp. CC-CFT747]